MTYSGNTPIQGEGTVSAAAIQAWFASRAQWGADYVKLPVIAIPPSVGADIVTESAAGGVNSDLVAAQIMKESAAWQSPIVRDKNNPSGLGAVNNNPYNEAKTFATPRDGIHATVAHLRTYIDGRANPWWDDDPRAEAVPARNLGVVRTLSDLDGKWAWPGVGYGASIASGANGLVEFAATYEEPTTMALIDLIGQRIAAHGREVHNISNRMMTDGQYNRYSGGNPTHTAVHYTAVNRVADTLEAEISSWVGHSRHHVNTQGWPGIAYTIGISPSGRVFLLGDAERWRYHVFNDNPRAFPVSNDLGGNQEPTSEMLESLRVVLTVLHTETPEFPNLVRETTYGHLEFATIGDPQNQTSCPGKLLPFVQAYRAGTVTPPTPPPVEETERTDPVTGFKIVRGFFGYYRFLEERLGVDEALLIVGRPLNDEYTREDGLRVQDFERARFEWHPGSRPDRFDVLLGRTNAELLEVTA